MRPALMSALLLMFAVLSVPAAADDVDVTATTEAREPVRLTLDECISIGLENNPEVSVEEAEVDGEVEKDQLSPKFQTAEEGLKWLKK